MQGWISSVTEFSPEPGRYHIYLNYGCGWCHQLLGVLALRGLYRSDSDCSEQPITVTHCGCQRAGGPRGTWEYQGYSIPPGADATGVGLSCMRDVYNVGTPGGCGYGTNQLTIPVLLDKKSKRVVSNDPAQIMLMLDYWAESLGGGSSGSLYTPELREEIEAVNSVVYPGINNGVYCCWFGGRPGDARFDEAFPLVQDALAWLERRLADNKAAGKGQFLLGTSHPTLADVRAFPHLFRFDGIYHEMMLKGHGERIFGESSRFPLLSTWLSQHMFGQLSAQRATCKSRRASIAPTCPCTSRMRSMTASDSRPAHGCRRAMCGRRSGKRKASARRRWR